MHDEPPSPNFLRHSPPDPGALQAEIDRARESLVDAERRGDAQATIAHAEALGARLTAIGRETEARAVFAARLELARLHLDQEHSGWFLHASATAWQYCGERNQADALFAEVLALARQHGWRELEHYALHHRGRCLAELGAFDAARACFVESLAIREALGDAPREASSRRALALLDEWESAASGG